MQFCRQGPAAVSQQINQPCCGGCQACIKRYVTTDNLPYMLFGARPKGIGVLCRLSGGGGPPANGCDD